MATAANGVKLIYGAAGFMPSITKGLPTDPDEWYAYTGKLIDILEQEKISTLDTAEAYVGSEEQIGFHGAADRFIVDTKLKGGFGPERTADEMVQAAKDSLEKLKTKQVRFSPLEVSDC
jgi:aflatoxin B1 aldehyde reductase